MSAWVRHLLFCFIILLLRRDFELEDILKLCYVGTHIVHELRTANSLLALRSSRGPLLLLKTKVGLPLTFDNVDSTRDL